MKRAICLAVCLSFALSMTSCATVFHPNREDQSRDQRGRVDIPCIILDVVFTAGLGVIVDVVKGTAWAPKDADWKPLPDESATEPVQLTKKSGTFYIEPERRKVIEVAQGPVNMSLPCTLRVHLSQELALNGKDVRATLREGNGKSVADGYVWAVPTQEGANSKDCVDVHIPRDYYKRVSGNYELALVVNGRQVGVWPVCVTQQ